MVSIRLVVQPLKKSYLSVTEPPQELNVMLTPFPLSFLYYLDVLNRIRKMFGTYLNWCVCKEHEKDNQMSK